MNIPKKIFNGEEGLKKLEREAYQKKKEQKGL